MTRLLSSVAVVALVAAYPALADTATTNSNAAAQTQVAIQQQDLDFVTRAAQGGMREVELGKLAAEKATSAEVKQYGQHMVEDHTKANEKLMALTQQKGIVFGEDVDDLAQEGIDEFAGVAPEEFDREYLATAVEDHEDMVELYQEQAESGADPELKQFAADTLPTVQEHLEMARAMSTQIAGTMGTTEQQAAVDQSATTTTTTEQTAEEAAADQAAADSVAENQAALDGEATVDPALVEASEEAVQQAQANPGGMTADDIIGENVVNAEGREIGDIKDIVLSQDKAAFVVVSVGGFLGIGDKDVALPFDRLQLGDDQVIMMSNVTEDELKQLPAYEPGDQYAEYPRNESLFGQTVDATGQAVDATGQAVDATGQAIGDVAEGTATAVDQAGEAVVATTDQAAEAVDQTLTEGEAAVGRGTDAAMTLGQRRGDEVVGKNVFNAQGEEIGEIEELVRGQDNNVFAIVSVGGFLGIGDRDVAVPLDQLTLGEDDAILMSNVTKEQLEGMEPWTQDDRWTALPRDQQILQQQ